MTTAVSFENALLEKSDRRSFKERVPDFHEGNILLDTLDPPIDGSNFKFWIIDQ